MPSSSVKLTAGLTVPAPSVTTHVTGTPPVGLPASSVTSTTRLSASAVPGVPTWPCPLTTDTDAGTPGTAVWVKVAGDPARPSDVAIVACGPEVTPSVRVTDARPSGPVVVSASLTSPPPSTLHTITTASRGLPNASVTSTTSGSASVVPAVPVCPSPDRMRRPIAEAGSAVTVKSAAISSSPGSSTRTRPAMVPTVGPSTRAACTRPSPSVTAVSGSTVAPSSSITTRAFRTGRPTSSVTRATSGTASGSPARPLWPSPSRTTTRAGSPSTGSTRSLPPQDDRSTATANRVADRRRRERSREGGSTGTRYYRAPFGERLGPGSQRRRMPPRVRGLS